MTRHKLPAHCDACGLTFGASGFGVGRGGEVEFDGCTITCPQCGKQARLGECVYSGTPSRGAVFASD